MGVIFTMEDGGDVSRVLGVMVAFADSLVAVKNLGITVAKQHHYNYNKTF